MSTSEPVSCPKCGATIPAGFTLCGPCSLEPTSALALLQAASRRRTLVADSLRATLAGLRAVNVQAEPLNADAEHDGLRRADLLADVEAALHRAGLRTLGPSELFLDPAASVLRLDVMTVRLDGRYAYSVRLELWQPVTLVRDPRRQTLAATWAIPQLVGTVAVERLAEVRSTVRSAVDAFLADVAGPAAPPRDFNLLVSSSWRGLAAARREIRALLRALGDEQPVIERMVAKGILGVRTRLDPRRVVRDLQALLEREPGRRRFTCRWVPVDTWTQADLDSLVRVVTGLREQIQPGETWRMTVEKHRHARHHRDEVITALARLIDAKVDLTRPDKILRIDLVGDAAAVSVLTPGDVLPATPGPPPAAGEIRGEAAEGGRA